MATINNPDEAIRRVLGGESVHSVVKQCEIGFPFERSDWAQCQSTLGCLLACGAIDRASMQKIYDLTLAIGELVGKHRKDSQSAISA